MMAKLENVKFKLMHHGHFLHQTDPESVNKEIWNFIKLEEVSTTGTVINSSIYEI